MILHSDRGSQFTSAAFRKVLAQYGAVQSMSGTGRCYDNARMESYFATRKKEKLYRIRTECMPLAQISATITGIFKFKLRDYPIFCCKSIHFAAIF